jgi:EpsD family peptidyl-prolyl cis-trans isomerase
MIFSLVRQIGFSFTLLATLGLSACGEKTKSSASTQVAAKVGSEEISVHQINQILRSSNTANASPQATLSMGHEVLEKLIDQQLVINQATENQLNRAPQVIADIEAAKRDVLARAYLQQIASSLPTPTEEEVKKYYAEHPELFSERRIFNLQEIAIPTTPGLAEHLRNFSTAGKTTTEVSAWLKNQKIAFNDNHASRTAEQMPLELLAKIHPLKDGQSIVLDTPKAVTFLTITSSQYVSIEETAAKPRIKQFLNNQHTNQAIAAKIKELRANTKITYQGEFTQARSGIETAPATKTSIEKGVAALK